MSESVLKQRGPWTASDLSAAAWSAYKGGGGLLPLMQRYRPYICPFELILERVPADSRVLDIGCGGGLFLMLLAMGGRLSEADAASIGFDISQAAVEQARRAAGRMGVTSVRFEQLDVGAPWPEGPFDVASIVDVLHHVPSDAQHAVIREAVRSIRPGGLLVYKDMCEKPTWRAAANRLHDLAMARDWIRYMPIDRVAVWFENAGLVIEEKSRTGRLWYGHEWLIARKPE